MASRSAHSSQQSVDQVAGALQRTGISEPAIRRAPPPPGIAGRRKGPGLKLGLGDITGVAAAGPAAAGLGAGRPSALDAPPDQPPLRRLPAQGELGTPFSNFRKIVYVASS